MHAYLALLRRAPRLLAFGFLLTFFSAFGQTFFMAVFGAQIRAEFALSHGGFGAIYSTATLASAALLPWLGRIVDRHDLRLVASAVVIGLAFACLLTALAGNAVMLGLAILALRLSGQGLMGHTALTAVARGFAADRGKAIGIVLMGFAASEVVFPQLAVVGLTVGWRATWLVAGVAVLLIVLPGLRWLQATPLRPGEAAAASAEGPPSWNRARVLRDRRFHLLLPGVVAPAIVATGIFFHQSHIVAQKDWSLALFALGFALFSTSAVTAALLVGGVIDRCGARRLTPVGALLLATGTAIMAGGEHRMALVVAMGVLGAANGVHATTLTALWAELYGTAAYGAIRALVASAMVFGSAISPFLLGSLFDHGVAVSLVLGACAVYALVAGLLMRVALKSGMRHRVGRAAP